MKRFILFSLIVLFTLSSVSAALFDDVKLYWSMDSKAEITQGIYNLSNNEGTVYFNNSNCFAYSCAQIFVNNSLKTPNNPYMKFNDSSSLNIWFRPTNITPAASDEFVILAPIGNNTGRISINNASSWLFNGWIANANFISSKTPPLLNTYNMITITRDNSVNGGNVSVYANGVILNSSFIGNANASLPLAWYLGVNTNNASDYVGTQFDEFMVWNRSLSASEIAQLYAGASGNSFYNSFPIYNSESFDNPVISSSSQTFILNITEPSGWDITKSYITYSGTLYDASITGSGANQILSATFSVPSVVSPTTKSFNWIVGFSNGSIQYNFTTDTRAQLINPLGIDNCTTNTQVIINYTLYDEDDRTFINPSTKNVTAEVYVVARAYGSSIQSAIYNNTLHYNPILVCMNSSLIASNSFSIDSTIKFSSTDHVTEYYYIENQTLNSTTGSLNISLYDLLITSSQEFLITVRDQSYLPLEGAIVELRRQYLDGAITPIVERIRTDTDGNTIGHFVLNDQIYDIYVYQNNVLLGTWTNQYAFCTDTATNNCRLALDIPVSIITPTNLLDYLNVTYSKYYNTTSRTYIFTFRNSDSIVRTFNLTGYLYNINQSTTICSDLAISSAGSLTCTIPAQYYNGTAMIEIYVNNNFLTQDIFPITRMGFSQSDRLLGYLIAFFLILTLPLMAYTSAPIMLVMFVIGFILSTGIYLLNSGSWFGAGSALVWLIIAIGVIIWKMGDKK